MENSDLKSLIESLQEVTAPPMKRTILVNHLRSGIISLMFLSHFIEVTLVLFLSIFLLGPAVFFIINGIFCGLLFFRPHWLPLLRAYKFLFRLDDEDFYMNEQALSLGFWVSRFLMVVFVVSQIAIGIYFLSQYGFLNQNLIHLLTQN
ncbi:MAG: hypothetical protein JW704_06995 [Anaerolineaceae bacterium]|nr:hypothetical protein [Anaerolineaceae bacterium]MBN2677302.1 hypothetical protein [Anaerolineaceae bacterium]